MEINQIDLMLLDNIKESETLSRGMIKDLKEIIEKQGKIIEMQDKVINDLKAYLKENGITYE